MRNVRKGTRMHKHRRAWNKCNCFQTFLIFGDFQTILRHFTTRYRHFYNHVFSIFYLQYVFPSELSYQMIVPKDTDNLRWDTDIFGPNSCCIIMSLSTVGGACYFRKNVEHHLPSSVCMRFGFIASFMSTVRAPDIPRSSVVIG